MYVSLQRMIAGMGFALAKKGRYLSSGEEVPTVVIPGYGHAYIKKKTVYLGQIVKMFGRRYLRHTNGRSDIIMLRCHGSDHSKEWPEKCTCLNRQYFPAEDGGHYGKGFFEPYKATNLELLERLLGSNGQELLRLADGDEVIAAWAAWNAQHVPEQTLQDLLKLGRNEDFKKRDILKIANALGWYIVDPKSQKGDEPKKFHQLVRLIHLARAASDMMSRT